MNAAQVDSKLTKINDLRVNGFSLVTMANCF